MTTSTCAFCAIVAGAAPAERVLDEPDVVAFLDARPLLPGHVLVVPRVHVPDFAALPPALLSALFGAAQRLAVAVEAALGADGAFVAVNHKVSQSVPHVHVHVVPRRRGDGLRGFFWPRVRYASAAEAAAIARRIAAAVAGPGHG
jgi:histidine triad (HIT) family protein